MPKIRLSDTIPDPDPEPKVQKSGIEPMWKDRIPDDPKPEDFQDTPPMPGGMDVHELMEDLIRLIDKATMVRQSVDLGSIEIGPQDVEILARPLLAVEAGTRKTLGRVCGVGLAADDDGQVWPYVGVYPPREAPAEDGA